MATSLHAAPQRAAAAANPRSVVIRDAQGNATSVPLVSANEKLRIARRDPRLDPRLVKAASIAQERANAHSKSRCWRYVKQALLAAGAVSSYPKSALAKQAGTELVRDFGFKKLPIANPYAAPVGAVLVYTAPGRGAGHVELRTPTGFVSDFRAPKPSRRRLIGIFGKA